MTKDSERRMPAPENQLILTMVRMFNRGRSFSSHLERKKSKCDYHFDRDVSLEEVKEIESRVNQIIQTDAEVREEFLPKEEAAKEFNLSRLPDQTGDSIRIIKIGDYDACPCIGEHVRATKEIGVFRIISTSYENGVLRLRFKLSDDLASSR
jgi:alanyl-tRNA synthetase